MAPHMAVGGGAPLEVGQAVDPLGVVHSIGYIYSASRRRTLLSLHRLQECFTDTPSA